MLDEPYYKTSKITGRTYDLFDIVRILNIQQAIWYIQNSVPLEDIEISEDRKTGVPVLVFYFSRTLSQKSYADWCERKH